MGADAGAAPRGQPCFVGREDVIEAVLGFLDEPGRGYRLRAGGTWGIGKTWLLDELDARSADRARVLHVRAGAHAPSPSAPGGSKPELDIVRNWNSYVDLVIDLTRSAPRTEEWGVLATQIHDSDQRVTEVRAEKIADELSVKVEIDVEGDMEATGGGAIASPTIGGGEPTARLEATIEAQRRQIEKRFARTLDQVGRASGAVILVDEFDRLRGYPVADWLLWLVTASDHAVVVIGTRVGGSMPAEGMRPLERMELGRFGAREVSTYLERRLGDEAVTEGLVERVLHFSDGLPQAVGMAADLVEQRRRTGGDVLLDDLGPKPQAATTDLLSTIVREVPEDDVRTLLREGRFARRIDADLIHYLLHDVRYDEGSAEQRQRADNALAKLREYSFVEDYDGEDDGLGRFRFHEYISRAKALPDDDTLRVDAEGVHARLAAYLMRRHDQWDEEHESEGVYRKLYKLESRDWQSLVREWLYHMSRLNRPETRAFAELAFARVFLQTFWWWGCYVRYDYCEALLADWEALVPRPRSWTARLHELLDAYPLGYQKLDEGDWAKVDRAMQALRDDGLGLGGPIPLDVDAVADDRALLHLNNRRWVRALTSLFRAHSYMYRSGAGDLAPPLFDDALVHLRAAGETSAVAWTTFELAELKLAMQDPDGASECLREVARLLAELTEANPDDRDYELLANVQRLHGDIAAANGDDLTAVDATARAVLRAYAFLNEPEPPDPYTVAFYEEMRERAARRLQDLAAKNDDDAGAAARRLLERLEILRRPFGLQGGAVTALQSGDRQALVALLPPPPRTLGEDARADETFALTSARVLHQVQQDPSDAELAEPPP